MIVVRCFVIQIWAMVELVALLPDSATRLDAQKCWLEVAMVFVLEHLRDLRFRIIGEGANN